MFITGPDDFAQWFNEKIPDACRKITSDDVSLLTDCKLIGRYNHYIRQDLETVRAVLQYEQLREETIGQNAATVNRVFTCKRCGQALTIHSQKKGQA